MSTHKSTLVFVAMAAAVALIGCAADETGSVTMNLTDAPTDEENVSGVYITIDSIEYHSSEALSGNDGSSSEGDDGEWVQFAEFTEPAEYNLMELTGGQTINLLSDEVLPAGKITQIRFMLDAPIQGEDDPVNPGCYIQWTDENDTVTTEPLFVPSGSESGFKATGEFDVPVNGAVTITADFDVRKSVVTTGSGNNIRYILKPTIRLIVDDQAGTIKGLVSNYDFGSGGTLVVYAYEDGTYTDSEADDPVDEESRFPEAVSSSKVETDTYAYTLAFLAAGTYDLILTESVTDESTGETSMTVLGFVPDVAVQSKGTTTEPIDVAQIAVSME